jgi:hypothetical protein
MTAAFRAARWVLYALAAAGAAFMFGVCLLAYIGVWTP